MRLLPLITFIFFFSVVNSQDKIYSTLLLNAELTENANAITRLDEMKVELTSIKEMNVSLTRVVTVLNKYGNKHVHAAVGYNNSVKVKHVEALIFDAFGEEIEKIKEKDFKDVSAVDGGTLYSDSRVLYMDYTPTQYPYTVVFSYEITTANTSNIPSWYFLDGFLVSMEKSSYTVTYSAPELKPIIKEKNLEEIKFEKTESANSISYEAENVLAIKKESLSPTFKKIAPKIMVRAENFHYEGYNASIRDWKDIGYWMSSNLLKDRAELPEATIIKARSLVRGVSDPLEKAKIIYQYVQNNTRYISVQVGIGGIQPISAIEVDRLKYGDCKGLSNYTKALLEAVGVPAYYTHVEAGRDKVDFEEDFADLGQGNHVILAIPYQDQYYWIDCTSQVHPFGFIGDFTDDRKVLVITPDGGEITSTPSYINEDNHQKTVASYELDGEGSLSADIGIVTEGTQYDNRFYLKDESPENVDKYYKNYWGNINNLKLVNYQFINDQEAVKFTEKIKVKAENYASKSGPRILFSPNAFDKNAYIPNKHRSRKLPFEIQRGFLDEDEFVINLPEGYKLEAMPNSKEIENEFGAYKMSVEYRQEDNTIAYRRRLLIKEGTYPKEKYKDYRSFRKQVSGMDNAQIVIIKSTP